MAKILVVDDNATNRKLVTAVLETAGHLVVVASDGADGLTIARTEQPQLIISDILMPSMDGYEFVRRLRSDQQFVHTAVIFYTAYYHGPEARNLAQSCGVSRVLTKPCPAAEMVQAVHALLAEAPEVSIAPMEEGFDHEHLRLVTNTLSQQTAELLAANAQLEALTELNTQLASEQEPNVLLEKVCRGARDLVAAKYAVLAVAEKGDPETIIFSTSGLEIAGETREPPQLHAGTLGRVVSERCVLRLLARDGETVATGLPQSYPVAQSFLAAPIASLKRIYGWVCLCDKIGAVGFDEEDERVLKTLGAQVGRIYENGSLYRAVEQHAAQLSLEMEERKLAAKQIEQLNRIYAVLSSVNSLIVRACTRDELLTEACRLAVEQGRFRAAWCISRDPETDNRTIVATAGATGDLMQRGVRLVDELAGVNALLMTPFQTQQLQICNDMEAELGKATYRDEMLALSLRAMAALPLTLAEHCVGCLVLATEERGFFDAAEIRLLSELAGDISFALDHIEKSDRLNYLAYYDALTGLANRTLFNERLSIHLAAAEREGRRVAVVIEDIDRFEAINDTFGRATGDELLRQYAERFTRCVGDSAAVARVGADRFAAVLITVEQDATISRAVEEWDEHLVGMPFLILGHELTISTKAGTAIFPGDGRVADTLLKNAEAALKTAKSSGERHLAYTSVLSERVAARFSLENRMRGALYREEFTLHYQPKVNLATRQLTGVEALVRWQSPDFGLLPPARFIPVMEENGLIVEVGAWILRRARRDRSRWLALGLPAPRVAVNVSTIQLRRDGFVGTLTEALELDGDDVGVDIEITESVIMENVQDNIQKLSMIRNLGVGIALDDFGTGYSSLAYLAKLPVDTLKIDRSFVAAMLDDAGAMTLISSIISLADSLRLDTVAEGVESAEQAKALRLLRCKEMQGFLICRPLPFEGLIDYLRADNHK